MPGLSTIRKAIVSIAACLQMVRVMFAPCRRSVWNDYNSCIDSLSIRCWDWAIHKPDRTRTMSQHTAAVALGNRLKFKHPAPLVALDDPRNPHQAPEAVNVAQPSASRMLGDIEEAFGFLLFERNARGMKPTPLGVVTLAYARRALAELTRFA